MAVDPIIECFWRDLVPEYCQGLESSLIYTAPPFFVESLQGRPYRSLPRLPLNMHAEDIIPTFLMSTIYIWICLPQRPHTDRTLVVRNVWSLANSQNQQKCGASGNSQLHPAKRRVSVPAGERDSTQGGSYVPSTIQGQNSTPSSWLNNFRVADITQRVTSTPSTTQR